MGANVFFDGEELDQIESGELIFLGVVTYNVKEEKLDICVSAERSLEESEAILKKFIRNARLIKRDKQP